MAFIGYVRAAHRQKLPGNRTLVESDPCKTRGEAVVWMNTMLESCVEAGTHVAEAGTRKHGKAETGKKRRPAPVETDTDVEREIAERQAEDAKSRRRNRRRSANRRPNHAPAAGKDAK